MGLMNPYIDDFQSIIIRAYSAGLHKAWEQMFHLDAYGNRNLRTIEENYEFLTFFSLIPCFLVIPFGVGFAFIVLLLEIFHHDFYVKLSWKDFLKRWSWKRKTQMRFKIIQVKPINDPKMD